MKEQWEIDLEAFQRQTRKEEADLKSIETFGCTAEEREESMEEDRIQDERRRK